MQKNNQYETFDRADDNVQHCEFSGKKISQAIILRPQIARKNTSRDIGANRCKKIAGG